MKQKSGVRGFFRKCYKYRVYLLMLTPAIIYILIFAYYPMPGIVLAFKKYNYKGGIWEAHGMDLKIFVSFSFLDRLEL